MVSVQVFGFEFGFAVEGNQFADTSVSGRFLDISISVRLPPTCLEVDNLIPLKSYLYLTLGNEGFDDDKLLKGVNNSFSTTANEALTFPLPSLSFWPFNVKLSYNGVGIVNVNGAVGAP